MPASWQSQYAPVNGGSVPHWRHTRYCSGVSSSRHSASDFSIGEVMGLSEHLARVVRQTRAFAAHQRDMPAVFPALEAVHHIGQAGAALGEVGRVDLRDVAETDDLGAGTRARDQRLHLFGREVLRLVDNQVFAEEGAAAHEVER